MFSLLERITVFFRTIFKHSYKTLKLENERLDLNYLEKTLSFEHKENEIRRQLVGEKAQLQVEIDSLKNEIFQMKLKGNEVNQSFRLILPLNETKNK